MVSFAFTSILIASSILAAPAPNNYGYGERDGYGAERQGYGESFGYGDEGFGRHGGFEEDYGTHEYGNGEFGDRRFGGEELYGIRARENGHGGFPFFDQDVRGFRNEHDYERDFDYDHESRGYGNEYEGRSQDNSQRY